ncbi:unnamed protein product [Ectocarpus sp. 6 AP-2014]
MLQGASDQRRSDGGATNEGGDKVERTRVRSCGCMPRGGGSEGDERRRSDGDRGAAAEGERPTKRPDRRPRRTPPHPDGIRRRGINLNM